MIGENIKRLMKENGYTQKELAIRARCTESAISKYINNERTPNLNKLIDIAISLGVTADELLGRNETLPRNTQENTKPKKTNFDKITESVESLAEFIEKYATNCHYCPLYKLEKCKLIGWKLESELCKKELKEWLQKECEG